ncbi:hypothetical protein L207DRAFT_608184 [Hyaloscypha variabilis F]|uniref:AB hydrolase-1 domain-containing protein n=1 Tax=Hyaloscypha variabilis (strain UAMH 11265 / GT02V1 / F) TaxID=1149755 RepID=A0A2J6R4G5_HYAVF|nr:hypothetical protein L207DRAFT_608184 [Hyaloscypha variabilis F]
MGFRILRSALASFLFYSLFGFLAIASPVRRNATQQYTFADITPTTDLQWFPCEEVYFCAMLQVPLDYSKPNGSQAAVPLIKLAAIINGTSGAYKGMILTNPGGPGNSGVESVLTYGDVLQSVIGTNFDIVAFDPRGIGNSIPLANCSAVPSSARRSLTPSGPDFTPSYYNNTLTAAIETAQACQIVIGGDNDAGPHMTTAVNVRDMHTKCTLVNYWGFSYGTYIGQVFASMFPDRVGHFVIDGVVDADTWVAGLGTASILFTDEAFASFFEFCHLAGSSSCSFYTGNSTKDIRHRFQKILSAVNGPRAEATNQTDASIVEIYLEEFKTLLFQSTYYPITFYPILSDALLLFEAATTNLTIDALINIGTVIDEKLANVKNVIVTQPALAEWFPAVYCSDGDASAYGETLKEFQPYIKALRSQSLIAGDLWAAQRVQCSVWSITSDDRFEGPFGGDTKTPILFVSNTVDPATPIIK